MAQLMIKLGFCNEYNLNCVCIVLKKTAQQQTTIKPTKAFVAFNLLMDFIQ